jgi:two-component system cell cycle sensor histidine kinase/response regulator CckA
MATILVVDDNAINRKLLIALLSGDGHLTLQASDGADGLAVARQHRPQLIISDILMPSMDGYAFVRALRREPQLRGTPVIFYTAHYHEREAHNLARSLGVSRVLVKPSPHAELLKAVEQVMAGVSESPPAHVPENFDREHLRLLTDKLSERAEALAASNSRFAALADLSLEIASQSDSGALLDLACAGARNLVGSQFAILAVADQSAQGGVFFTTSGLDNVTHPVATPDLHAGALGEVLAQRRPWRSCCADGAGADGGVAQAGAAQAGAAQAGLPPGYPQARAFLAVPLMTPSRTFGWLCLADKIGAECFDGDDEKLLLTLGGQVSRTFENTRLHAQLRWQSAQLDRVHSMLRGVQGLIANGQDDEEICKAACNLCVDAGGYSQAFVECGAPAERDDLVELANNSRSPAICNDLQSTQLRVRLREELLQRGYRSVAVLPLGSSGRRLILARQETCAFDEAELRLLRDMAAGFSLALARNSEAVVGS